MATLIEYFDHLEGDVCRRINRYSRGEVTRRFFAAISKLGDGWYWVALAAACLLQDAAAAAPFLLRAAATALVGIAIYKFLKHRLIRERPYVAHLGIVRGAAPLDRYSFPSGHTMHATGFAVMFTSWDPVLLWVAAPFALLVAASRVVLGLHYPTDVLAGAALGAGLAVISNSL